MDSLSGNIVVLIDPHTRRAVDSITYDALAKHVTVITDIRELGDAHYGCDFVFFEPAVPGVVTPEALRESVELYGIKAHLVYSIPEVGALFANNCHCVVAAYKMLEWNLVYAVIHEDLAILEPYQRTRQEPPEFAKLIEALPDDCTVPVDRMYRSYLSLAKSYQELVTRHSKTQETLAMYRSVSDKTTRAISELKGLLKEATDSNRVYSAMLSESYDVTFTGLYPDRPRVLYIKQISHLAGIDNLLAVLYSTITRQYKVSCKIIKLVDQANATSLRYVPNIYVPLTDSYNTYDVLTNDFLLSLGAYNVLMGLIMLNRSGLDFVIVHDQRGVMGDALDSALVDLKLVEVSGDYAVLGEYDNVLSDVEKQVPFYWSFKDTAGYTGSNVVKLSNHPTVGKILDYLL